MLIFWRAFGRDLAANFPAFVWPGGAFFAAVSNLDGITSGDGGLGISCASGIVHRRAELNTYRTQKIPYATP